MEHRCGAVHEPVEKSTDAVGKFDPVLGSPQWLQAVSGMLSALGWPAISCLARELAGRPGAGPVHTLDELAMWEAELRNQGLVPPETDLRLGHFAAHQSNHLRWRALRSGVPSSSLAFKVNVRALIVARAEQLIAGVRTAPETRERGGSVEVRELRYLEALSARLIEQPEQLPSRYHRGLELLLRVIGAGRRSGAPGAPDGSTGIEGTLVIELPVAMPEFATSLRLHKRGLLKPTRRR